MRKLKSFWKWLEMSKGGHIVHHHYLLVYISYTICYYHITICTKNLV